MRQIRVELEDDAFWFLYSWAAREHRKAHEQAAALIDQAVRIEMNRAQTEVGAVDDTEPAA